MLCSAPKNKQYNGILAVFISLRINHALKKILLDIGFIEEIRTTVLEVTTRCPNVFPEFPLFAKIRFNPFDSVSLGTPHLVI